jgi:hypothetical protein
MSASAPQGERGLSPTEMMRRELRAAAKKALRTAERKSQSRVPLDLHETLIEHVMEQLRVQWLDDARTAVAVLEALRPTAVDPLSVPPAPGLNTDDALCVHRVVTTQEDCPLCEAEDAALQQPPQGPTTEER